MNPALEPGKQHHSEAKGTLGGQQSEQPCETNHERISKEIVKSAPTRITRASSAVKVVSNHTTTTKPYNSVDDYL